MRTKKVMFFLGTFLVLLYTVIIMKYQIEKIKKPSAMIQTNVKELTLTQRKIINFLIYTAQQFGDQRLYSTTLGIIKQMCKIGKTENLGLKEQFKALKKIDIEFNYLDKDKNNVWEVTGILCSARVSDTTGEITFEIPYMLREKILNPEIYTPLNVHLIAGLKSKYSIVLYELLRDYLYSPEFPKLSIVQLRKLLGLKEKQYKLFKDFKKRVLDWAVDEVNSKTDIKCSYLLIKEKGNKYSHIKFTVKENKLFQLPATVKTDKNFCLFLDDNSVPNQVIMHLPEKHRISGIYRIIQPWFSDVEYLISNIEYTNKNCKTNYSAFLNLALKEDYAQVSRESNFRK